MVDGDRSLVHGPARCIKVRAILPAHVYSRIDELKSDILVSLNIQRDLRHTDTVHPIAAVQMKASPFALEVFGSWSALLPIAREFGVAIFAYFSAWSRPTYRAIC
jgi:hypothetical protein